MRRLLLTVPLVLSIGLASGGELQRHQPAPVSVVDRFEYDPETVEPVQAERIAGHFLRRFGDEQRPEVYGIPDASDLFLVAVSADHRDDRDFGSRFYLVGDEAGGLRELRRGPGAGDSWFLRPTFFFGEGRVLVLAETGAEDFWGLDAYSVEDGTLVELDGLDVGIPDGETVASPLDRLKILVDGPALWVEISSDVVLDPGGRHERFLQFSGEAVRFDRVDDRFVLVGRPAP